MEITHHPILGELPSDEKIAIEFEGQKLWARKGQTVASALMANGIYTFGVSRKFMQARGLFCANGRCCSCFMTVDGREHVRVCMIRVEEGMKIETKKGDPDVRRDNNEG